MRISRPFGRIWLARDPAGRTDGVAFRAEQQRDPSLVGIPVVVFSAYGNVARAAAELSAVGHLRKPLGADALLDTILRVTGTAATAVTPR